MMRSRRNSMLACRCANVETGAVLSGYFAWMHAITCGPVGSAQEPAGTGVPGVGVGPGLGAGAAGVLNVCVALHALVVSRSLDRDRQYIVSPLESGELLNEVWPAPSLTMPAATSLVNAWSVATWNS